MNANDYIFFEEEPTDKKTRIVSVRNRRSGGELGKIRWYAAWRQYCFFPEALTIFNPTCMERIVGEIRVMQSAHRAWRLAVSLAPRPIDQ